MTDGFLLINKPENKRCSEIINTLKKNFKIKSAGYAGTLDSFASGLLVTGLNKATKLLKYITELDKTYEATMHFGSTTDTLDSTGKIISVSGKIPKKLSEITKVLKLFEGTIDQVPPVFSAKKIKGIRASDFVRKGQIPQLNPCKVTIKSIKVLSYDNIHGILKLLIICSKGTYIRSLARDISKMLDTVAFVERLIRLSNGPFKLEDSKDINDPELLSNIIPIRDCLPFMEEIIIKESALTNIKNGKPFRPEDCYFKELKSPVFKVIFNNSLIAIAKRESGVFRIIDNFSCKE